MSDSLPPSDARRRKTFSVHRIFVGMFAVACLLPTVIAATARWWWFGDLCCHFRVQYVAILMLAAVWCGATRRRWWFLFIIVGLAVNIGLVSPLFIPTKHLTMDSSSLRLMTANVFVRNQNHQSLIDLVKREQPDILLLLEVNDDWMADVSQLAADYTYRIDSLHDPDHPSIGAFGCALLSKIPIHHQRIKWVGTAQLPVVFAEFEHQDVAFRMYGAHSLPPRGGRMTALRNDYLEALTDLVASQDGRTIVMGDLNTTRWSPVFHDLTEIAGLHDSSEGFGFQPTWPDGMMPQIAIDHVLVSADVRILDHRVGPTIASDHLPVIVDVTIGPDKTEPSSAL